MAIFYFVLFILNSYFFIDDMILYDMVQDDEEGMIGGGDYYD